MAIEDGRTVGLALSGGGFRASLFNLGSLWRLNELGWLSRLDRITSVSGGSITSAWLALKWVELDIDSNGVAQNFDTVVAKPIETFCAKSLDIPTGLRGLLNPFGSASKSLVKSYDRHLFKGANLQQLPDDSKGNGPHFIIYATSYQTGVSFRFSRSLMGDWRVGELDNPSVSIATAVAASSGFPPFFAPLELKTRNDDWHGGVDSLPDRERIRTRLQLVDGGVYDNMGVERIMKGCDIALVSDAGARFKTLKQQRRNWFGQLSRVRDIGLGQAQALRRRMIVEIKNRVRFIYPRHSRCT